MSTSKEIKQIQEQVKQLLIANPMYRDSDKKLSAKIWAIQMGGMEKLKKISAFEFLIEYTQDHRLTSQESIGRARRKLQEENIELRGKKYKAKQEEQAEVVDVLGYGKKKND